MVGKKFTCALFQIDPEVGEDYLRRPDQKDPLSTPASQAKLISKPGSDW